MKGDHKGLINAAKENAKNTISKDKTNTNILFDCIIKGALYG